MTDNVTRYESDRVSSPSIYGGNTRNQQLVFFDGQVPDETGPNRGVREQTLAALERVDELAAEADVGVRDLMRTTVYLTDAERSESVKRAYDEFFDDYRPARTIVGVESLPSDAAVQIEATGVDR